jgi:polyhydroxyalkanoate synthase
MALALAGCLWAPRLKRPHLEDEIVYARTADGWNVAMHHYRPAMGTPGQTMPVIVCHGISANQRSWSLTPERSLPMYLAARGWDVWAIDLRGVGESTIPGVLFDDKSFDFTFDDFVTQDLPAVIAAVKKQTGAPRVNWIGHSMGGMVVYGYLTRYGDGDFETVTAVASPVAFFGVNQYFEWAKGYAAAVSGYIPAMRDENFLWLISGFVGRLDTPIEYQIWNTDNFTGDAAGALVYQGVGGMGKGVLRQLVPAFVHGRLLSLDGKLDYVAGLSRAKVPLHVTAGIEDNLSPPLNTLPAYDAWGGKDKTFTVFARANGDHDDYGHIDMTVGDHAREDVYPALERWMRSRQW